MYRFTKADYSKLYMCVEACIESLKDKVLDDENREQPDLVEKDKVLLDDMRQLRDKVAAHICSVK